MSDQLAGLDFKTSWAETAFFASLPSSAYPFTAISAGQLLLPGRYIVRGVSFVNNNAAAVVLSLYDGQSATSTLLGVASAAAGLADGQNFGSHGVMTEIGLYVSPSAGPVSGTVYAVPLWVYNNTPPGQ